MKKLYIPALAAILTTGALSSCGSDFLEVEIPNGVDLEKGLTTVPNIGYALNGTYDRFGSYYFTATWGTAFGDIASDISYWNGLTGHYQNEYQFKPTETDSYIRYIWEYGYKVIDNSARIIKAGNELLPEVSGSDRADLQMYLAEAYALRAYASFALTNIYGHQYKVAGQDFGSNPGIVIVEEPVEAGAQVSRSSVADCYNFIISDLQNSLSLFREAGQDKGTPLYFGEAAAHGLLSRVYLYAENWAGAESEARAALTAAGNKPLAYTADEYLSHYNVQYGNSESFLYVAITPANNFSANSMGTLWSTYNYSPSPYLRSLYAADDVRLSTWADGKSSTPSAPVFNGGKYQGYGAPQNPAYATCYLINAPEMWLNIAEAAARQGKASDAAEALLVVAKRNPAITDTGDLPSGADAILAFIRDERARELFQEGFRLFDLRRWDITANLSAINAPSIDWEYKNYQVSKCVFPIPAAEINTHAGVTQNEGWSGTFPSI